MQAYLLKTSVSDMIPQFIQWGQIECEEMVKVDAMKAYPSQLSSPSGLALTATTGTLPAATYAYKVTALDALGETLPCAEVQITLGAPGGVILNWTANASATSYKVYGRTASTELYIATTTTNTYTDSATAITPLGAMPTANTTNSLRSGTNSIPVPDAFLELNHISLINVLTNYRAPILRMESDSKFVDRVQPVTTNIGMPLSFTQIGSNFVFDRYTDMDYTLDYSYYARQATLVNDYDTNYWTLKESKLLTFASLREASYFIPDDPRGQAWREMFDHEIDQLRTTSALAKIHGGRPQGNKNMIFRKKAKLF